MPPSSPAAARNPCSYGGSERATRRSSPQPTSSATPREASRGHESLPVHLYAFLSPLPGPGLSHLFWHRLLRLAHHINAQAHHLFNPPLASALVAGIDPQMREARKASAAHRLQQSSLIPSASGTLAL